MADKKRLIDANEAIANTYEEVYCTESEQAWLRHFIIKQQTVDAVEVVHGRWKYYHKQNKAVCTNCSFERDLDVNFGRAISCPNCCAKMDVERDGVEKC